MVLKAPKLNSRFCVIFLRFWIQNRVRVIPPGLVRRLEAPFAYE